MKRAIFILKASFVFFSTVTASASTLTDDFYWNGSQYGRGIGSVLVQRCDLKKNIADGLCYESCRDGYDGKGPVCWQKQENYGRGSGKVRVSGCKRDEEKDAGLCYDKCREGYDGKGPVCWPKGNLSYARGAGVVPNLQCPSDKVEDASLCYKLCRDGFNGVGPVCWAKPPQGYVSCGLGFAKNQKICSNITENQISSVATFIVGTVAPGIINSLKAGKSADELKAAQQISEEMSPFWNKIKGPLDKLSKKIDKTNEALDEIKIIWKQFLTPEQMKKLQMMLTGAKVGAKAGGAVYSIAKGNDALINILRDVAGVASVIDQTGASAIIEAYMYPSLKK